MDFNDATGKQRKTDLIPANTIAAVAMHVRSGNAGPGGWLKRAKDGRSEALDVVFSQRQSQRRTILARHRA